MKTVRAAVLTAAYNMSLERFELPKIREDDALLQIEMVGVCASDARRYVGKLKSRTAYPAIMGHEILGRIAEIGEVAAKRWGVKRGDRVVTEVVARCGYCSRCITGEYRFCENPIAFGGPVSASTAPHLWGGYAEYMYLPAGSLVYKISEEVPAEAGVLVNAVVADAIRWGRMVGGFCIGDTVVIQGVGQQGLCQVIVAAESGCNPIIATGLTKDEERFELAKKFGAHHVIDVEKESVVQRVKDMTNGQMADVVVDVTGSPKSIPVSIDLVRTLGTLVIPSVYGDETAVPIVTDRLVLNDIKVFGTFAADFRSMEKAIKLVESRKYAIEKMVTHIYPLEEAETAVRAVAGLLDGVYPTKAVVRP